MIRVLALLIVISRLTATCCAQAQPAPEATITKPATRPAKSPAPKPRTVSKPSAPTDSGPCRIGVIPAVSDKLGVKTIGLTVFGNEYSEAPIDNWGLDDLVVARVRAAAGPGVAVRRIAYAAETLAAYYHPPVNLLRRPDDDLTALVQKIAGNANCERYVIVTRFDAQFGGTNQTVNGVSIVRQGIGDLIKHTYLVTYVQARILDGQSFAIHKSPVSFGAILKSSFTGRKGPVREIDNAMFPTSASEAANSPKLRDEARGLLTETLDTTLPELLGSSSSAAGD